MTVHPRGNTYQADIRFMGERIRHSFSTPDAAHLWMHDAERDVIAGRRPSAPLETNKSFTLKEALDRVASQEWRRCKSGKHLTHNGTAVVDLIGPSRQLRSITFTDVEDLVTALRKRGDGNGTINRKLAGLSKLFTYAKKHDPSLNKPSIPRLREAPPRQRTLTDDEFTKLRQWDGWRDEDLHLLVFLWYTGARISEALRLKVADWDTDNVTFKDTKNGDSRTIPLHHEALYALRAGTMPNPWTFRHRFREAAQSLGLGEDVVVHTLRHSCASRLAKKQMNAFLIQKWMGHKSIATTQRYVKAAPTDLGPLRDAL